MVSTTDLNKIIVDKYNRGVAVIDLTIIDENANIIKRTLNSEAKIYAVVKADAYGHGVIEVANRFDSIDFVVGYGVATYEEAMELVQNSIRKPILVLGYTFQYAYESMILNNIRISVSRLDMLNDLNDIALRISRQAYIHITIDTGMKRQGIRPDDEGIEFVRYALNLKGIKVEGIFTHFACADCDSLDSTNSDYQSFIDFANQVKEMESDVVTHCSNSAASMRCHNYIADYIRPGIILYGVKPSKAADEVYSGLKPAMSIYSRIIGIREVRKGEGVGYGHSYIANHTMKVATIPLGYADGYPRELSNIGKIIIRGQYAPIVGRICMDQFMVDISDIPNAELGELVTLLGEDGECSIDIYDLSHASGRFYYEILCGIGKRVPRLYLH